MKRLVSLLLMVSLILGVLAGCGGGKEYSDSGEDVTLKWVIPMGSQTDLSLVQDKVNEKLPEHLSNTKIEFICDAAMGEKWSLWIAGKNSFDIACSGFAMDLFTEIQKKSFLSLNELVDEYAPTIKKERDELYVNLYNTGSYNGELYGIPAIQFYVDKYRCLNISNSIVKYFDTDALIKATHGKPHITEEAYKLMDDCLVKANKAGIHTEIYATYMWENCPAKIGYVFIGGKNSNLCYDPHAKEVKIIDWHETEEFKTYIKWMSKWYKDGYINKDVMAGGVPKVGDGYGNLWLGANTDNVNFGDKNIYERENDTYIKIESADTKINASYDIGSIMTYLSIPATAKNPVRAIKLIEALRTEKGAEILNLIAYGIEGTHYEKLNDTDIKAFDYESQGTASSKYGIPSWMLGNMMNGMYAVYPYTQKTIEYAENYYTEIEPNIKKHELFGFCFDLSKFIVQMTNIRNANQEYESQLGYGVASNTEQTLKNLTDNLDKAGMKTVIEDLQKQADEYISSK
ncbi:MAG: ABC transporter substrate-binding protein [Clostridia bacterium]|nr:ABC transporter substrate-binding protein [Clostridia bacterium]